AVYGAEPSVVEFALRGAYACGSNLPAALRGLQTKCSPRRILPAGGVFQPPPGAVGAPASPGDPYSMATVTFDGRSFMLDGRRIWLVSGQVAYGRIPREHWADRIHAAKLAGLNTIETPVFWSQHEPR